MTRWPLEPLHALARTRDGERLSLKALSIRLGLNPSTVQQWSKRGIPSDTKAEEAAVACGFDPYVVWGDEWTVAQEARYSKPCAECGGLFVPFNTRQRFCKPDCRTRNWGRKSYRERPDLRAKRTQYRKEYYASSAEYEKKKQRQKYWENPEAERQRVRDYRARLKEAG